MIRNISLATMIASLLISSIFVFAQMEEAGEAAEEITETPATLSPAVTGIIALSSIQLPTEDQSAVLR